MSNTLEPRREFLSVSDLSEQDEVRKQFERRSHETSAQGARPTEIGLTDPSQPLKNYCPKCGVSVAEPFGDHKIASRLNANGVTVEVYPNGGVLIYVDGQVHVSTRSSRGLGTSGQLGFTRVTLTPEK